MSLERQESQWRKRRCAQIFASKEKSTNTAPEYSMSGKFRETVLRTNQAFKGQLVFSK